MLKRRGCGVAIRIAAILAILSVVGFPGVSQAEGMGKDKFKTGDAAPDFTIPDLSGQNVQLSSFVGKKVVLLNFWGLRCGACLEEMPYLEKIWKKYADKGLVVLGVDTDGVDRQTVVDTLKEVKVAVGYPLLLDQEFKVTDVYTNFLVPLTIVIDKQGIIQYIHTGFEKGDEKAYEEAIRNQLGS